MQRVTRIVLALLVALTLAGAGYGRAQAQVAKTANWQVSLTVLNVDTQPATMTITFYPGGGAAPIDFQPAAALNPGAGTSYSVASINGIAAGFKGSAVVSSDARVVSTVVQFVAGGVGGRNVRPVSNGFQPSDAAPSYLIPTVLNNNFNTTTVFAIQNAEAEPITATVTIYSAGSDIGRVQPGVLIAPGASHFVDMSKISGITELFSGSATVSAIKSSDGSPANVVVSSSEYNTTNYLASSVEATKGGSNTIYMPSMLCKLSGVGTASSAYAVQNADVVSSTFTLTVRKLDGSVQLNSETYTLKPGAKASVNLCTSGFLPAGFNGSAVINSTGGKIVAVGKVYGEGLSTAFLGATSGAQVLAAPYIRYAPNTTFQTGARQRTFIAVQNLGVETVPVTVSYRNKDGAEVKSVTLNVPGNGGKANTDPGSAGALDSKGRFGEYDDGSFGGGVIITGPTGAKLVATVRVLSGVGAVRTGEDYNAIPVQ
jgi:hypothetical protein